MSDNLIRPDTLKPCDISFENHIDCVVVVRVEDLGDKIVYHLWDKKDLELHDMLLGEV